MALRLAAIASFRFASAMVCWAFASADVVAAAAASLAALAASLAALAVAAAPTACW